MGRFQKFCEKHDLCRNIMLAAMFLGIAYGVASLVIYTVPNMVESPP
jgi:hypothetical protein